MNYSPFRYRYYSPCKLFGVWNVYRQLFHGDCHCHTPSSLIPCPLFQKEKPKGIGILLVENERNTMSVGYCLKNGREQGLQSPSRNGRRSSVIPACDKSNIDRHGEGLFVTQHLLQKKNCSL